AKFGTGEYVLKINGVEIYDWYLRPRQEQGYVWHRHDGEVLHMQGTRYRNPIRSYPSLVEHINKYKLGSTLSIKMVYDTCVDFGIPLAELDADLRQLGWGDAINKWAFSTEEE
ncbi:hypothetical protein MUP59_05625, partial [Candidatus Bathyarchaeota archaeon]|nr:hypothetical protein [Candidatus Bathyarchaeota archaeon]